MKATTIDEVILLLDQIIDEATSKKSKLAFFPILYRKVTIAVKEGIENKAFEDNERMEKLDVIFANRYLSAYEDFKNGKACSSCWQVAFEQGNRFWPIVLQQLLLGINAHINLDLGIAAAETSPQNISSLKDDFDQINKILSGMVEEVQTQIGRISPLIQLLDSIAGRIDERLVDFSIEIARDGAWQFANEYVQSNNKEELTQKRDASIAWLAKDLAYPVFPLNLLTGLIKLFEVKKVAKISNALEGN